MLEAQVWTQLCVKAQSYEVVSQLLHYSEVAGDFAPCHRTHTLRKNDAACSALGPWASGGRQAQGFQAVSSLQPEAAGELGPCTKACKRSSDDER